jgi:hypothetical protein
VQASDENPMLIINDYEIGSIIDSRHWRIVSNAMADIHSPVTLGVNDVIREGSQIVVQADQLGGKASSLGFSCATPITITSEDNVTARIVAIARRAEAIVKIHEVITPFGSPGVNDKLVIENIGEYESRKVLLLDRWGIVVKTWNGEEVTDEIDYDFTQVTPDSYICIVEYRNSNQPVKKLSQMVVVISNE